MVRMPEPRHGTNRTQLVRGKWYTNDIDRGDFNEPSFITIGDDYDKKRYRPSRHNGVNMVTAPVKKGSLPDAFFSKDFMRLFEGDVVAASGERLREIEKDREMRMGRPAFKPSNPGRKSYGWADGFGLFGPAPPVTRRKSRVEAQVTGVRGARAELSALPVAQRRRGDVDAKVLTERAHAMERRVAELKKSLLQTKMTMEMGVENSRRKGLILAREAGAIEDRLEGRVSYETLFEEDAAAARTREKEEEEEVHVGVQIMAGGAVMDREGLWRCTVRLNNKNLVTADCTEPSHKPAFDVRGASSVPESMVDGMMVSVEVSDIHGCVAVGDVSLRWLAARAEAVGRGVPVPLTEIASGKAVGQVTIEASIASDPPVELSEAQPCNTCRIWISRVSVETAIDGDWTAVLCGAHSQAQVLQGAGSSSRQAVFDITTNNAAQYMNQEDEHVRLELYDDVKPGITPGGSDALFGRGFLSLSLVAGLATATRPRVEEEVPVRLLDDMGAGVGAARFHLHAEAIHLVEPAGDETASSVGDIVEEEGQVDKVRSERQFPSEKELRVTIVGGEMGMLMEWYCVIRHNDQSLWRTAPSNRTKTPGFDESAAVMVPDDESAELVFEMWDWEKLKDKRLGAGTVALGGLVVGLPNRFAVEVLNGSGGAIGTLDVIVEITRNDLARGGEDGEGSHAGAGRPGAADKHGLREGVAVLNGAIVHADEDPVDFPDGPKPESDPTRQARPSALSSEPPGDESSGEDDQENDDGAGFVYPWLEGAAKEVDPDEEARQSAVKEDFLRQAALAEEKERINRLIAEERERALMKQKMELDEEERLEIEAFEERERLREIANAEKRKVEMAEKKALMMEQARVDDQERIEEIHAKLAQMDLDMESFRDDCKAKEQDIKAKIADVEEEFWVAAQEGYTEVVGPLAKVFGINNRDELGRTALHISSWFGHSPLVQYILTHGGDADSTDGEGRSPLFFSILQGHEDVTALLLHHKATMLLRDKQGVTPVHVLIRILTRPPRRKDDIRKATELAERYLPAMRAAAEADDVMSVRAHCWIDAAMADSIGDPVSGRTFLSIAAMHNSVRTIEYLTSKKTRVNTPDVNMQTSLHCLSTVSPGSDPHEALRYLIDAGGDVNHKSSAGRTPLHLASLNGHSKCADMLIKAGADIAARDTAGDTPLLMAARGGDVETLLCLMSHDCNIYAANRDKYTALHICAVGNHVEAARVLIQYDQEDGYLETARTRKGHRPDALATTKEFRGVFKHMFYVARTGDRATGQSLLCRGDEVNETGPIAGYTPLHVAARHGNPATAAWLISMGGEVNRAAKDGCTPLHEAAKAGASETCQVLIGQGADRGATNHAGRTPAEEAAAAGHSKLAAQISAGKRKANKT